VGNFGAPWLLGPRGPLPSRLLRGVLLALNLTLSANHSVSVWGRQLELLRFAFSVTLRRIDWGGLFPRCWLTTWVRCQILTERMDYWGAAGRGFHSRFSHHLHRVSHPFWSIQWMWIIIPNYERDEWGWIWPYGFFCFPNFGWINIDEYQRELVFCWMRKEQTRKQHN